MSNKKGIMGRKLGMTQIFGDDGRVVVVTVVQAGPCYVAQVKEDAVDGYKAVQLCFEKRPIERMTKPMQGHLRKWGLDTGFRFLKEFKWPVSEEMPVSGTELNATMFSTGDFISVRGKTKGKGTQGVMRRWGFSGMPATHGNEKTPRSGGSIGNNTFPGKVFPGKKMAGRMGNQFVTRENLQIVAIFEDKNLILVKGCVPGSKNGLVVLTQQ